MKKIILLAGFLFASYVNAGIIGQDVTFQCPQCQISSSQTFTALAGQADGNYNNQLGIDVEAGYIRFDWLMDIEQVIPTSTSINLSWDATLFSLATAILASGSQNYAYSYGADFISIDLGGHTATQGTFFQLNITEALAQAVTPPASAPVSVPEPSPIFLFGLGVAGLLISRRTQRI